MDTKEGKASYSHGIIQILAQFDEDNLAPQDVQFRDQFCGHCWAYFPSCKCQRQTQEPVWALSPHLLISDQLEPAPTNDDWMSAQFKPFVLAVLAQKTTYRSSQKRSNDFGRREGFHLFARNESLCAHYHQTNSRRRHSTHSV